MRYAIPLIAILLIALLAPFIVSEAYLYVLGMSYLFIILVVSWDLMVGYTGYVNLGHTVFIGVGAYTAALLQSSRLFVILPPYISVIVAGAFSALIGFLIGIITLRLRGYYFALVTAILPLVFMQTVFIWRDLFGGEEGFSITGIQGTVERYYISLASMLICVLIILYIARSQIGLKFKSIREDEELAEAIGINTTKYKILAFVLSSFFAGIGGALIVNYRCTVSPDLYDIPLMLLIILSAVLGGLGTIYGSIIGGFLIYLAKNWWLKPIISQIPSMIPVSDDIILYTILIVIGILMPRGIYEELRKVASAIVKKT